MATTAEILGEVPFFALLDEAERAALAERVDEKKFARGQSMFHQNDPGGSLFIVRAGEVELWIKRDTGEKMILETAKAGDFFGEISLLDGGPRTASATVIEDCEVIVVDRTDLDDLFRIKPAAAMDLLSATGRRLRETNRLLRMAAAKDINEETADHRSRIERAADWVTEFSGSIPFLLIHLVWFTVWIVLNVEPLASSTAGGFDPFPFGLLTMCVSLEAIILSVLVMLSQNRQVARDRIRNDIEYQVNVSAEAKVAHLHEKVDRLHEEILARIQQLQAQPPAPAPSGSKEAP